MGEYKRNEEGIHSILNNRYSDQITDLKTVEDKQKKDIGETEERIKEATKKFERKQKESTRILNESKKNLEQTQTYIQNLEENRATLPTILTRMVPFIKKEIKRRKKDKNLFKGMGPDV